MSPSLANLLTDPLLLLALASSIGLVLYLALDLFQDLRQRRREQRLREEVRRHFWGYE